VGERKKLVLSLKMQVKSNNTSFDFLSMIWKAMQEEKLEKKQIRQKDERGVQGKDGYHGTGTWEDKDRINNRLVRNLQREAPKLSIAVIYLENSVGYCICKYLD